MWHWLKSKLTPTRDYVAEEAAAQIRAAALLQRSTSPSQWLKEAWANDRTYEPRRSNASAQVEAIEARYDIRIPEDFRAYLCDVAPLSDFMDDVGTSWWSIENVKNVPDECSTPPGKINPKIEMESDKYLIFADYLIWCYAWAICCSESANRGKIALIGGMPNDFVADDFRQFVALEFADSRAIH